MAAQPAADGEAWMNTSSTPSLVPHYLLTLPVSMDGLLLSILHAAETDARFKGGAKALRVLLAGQLMAQGSKRIPSPAKLRGDLNEMGLE